MDGKLRERIEQVLAGRVRPYLHGHGGTDLLLNELLGGDGGGGAAGALAQQPHPQHPVLQARYLYLAAVPEVKQVVLIQEVSRDLLDQARAILNHSRENGHG